MNKAVTMPVRRGSHQTSTTRGSVGSADRRPLERIPTAALSSRNGCHRRGGSIQGLDTGRRRSEGRFRSTQRSCMPASHAPRKRQSPAARVDGLAEAFSERGAARCPARTAAKARRAAIRRFAQRAVRGEQQERAPPEHAERHQRIDQRGAVVARGRLGSPAANRQRLRSNRKGWVGELDPGVDAQALSDVRSCPTRQRGEVNTLRPDSSRWRATARTSAACAAGEAARGECVPGTCIGRPVSRLSPHRWRFAQPEALETRWSRARSGV